MAGGAASHHSSTTMGIGVLLTMTILLLVVVSMRILWPPPPGSTLTLPLAEPLPTEPPQVPLPAPPDLPPAPPPSSPPRLPIQQPPTHPPTPWSPPTASWWHRQEAARRADGVVRLLNHRFMNGTPSNDLATAGVLVHVFDFGMATDFWNAHGWAEFVDRVSGSVFNRRLPYVYAYGFHTAGGNGIEDHTAASGIVLEPGAAQDALWCAWSGDAGTTGKPACRPSCGGQGQQGGYCAWPAEQFEEMMKAHEQLNGVPADPNRWQKYNEVMWHAQQYKASMPSIVQAFFGSTPASLAFARQTRARFAEHFGLSSAAELIPPLLRLNVSSASTVSSRPPGPFTLVEPGAPSPSAHF